MYRCGCGKFMDKDEECCLKCYTNDLLEAESIDKYFEYEEILKDISEDDLRKINVELKLQE